MPDNDQEGSNAQGDVLESPEVKAAIEAAKSEGYSQGQSAADKGNKQAIEKAREEAKTAQDALNRLEAERVKNLPPDEKRDAMLETVYNRLLQDNQEPAPDSDPTPDNKEPQNSEAADRLAQVLKRQGLNPEEFDMSSTENFIKSMLNRKADKSEESEDIEEEPDPVDTSTNASVGVDENKPLEDVFRAAYRRKHK